MSSRKQALRQIFARPIVTRSAAVAVVVGSALNAINQGPEVWRGEEVVVWKLLLTYCVPFLVASYGSYNALRVQ